MNRDHRIRKYLVRKDSGNNHSKGNGSVRSLSVYQTAEEEVPLNDKHMRRLDRQTKNILDRHRKEPIGPAGPQGCVGRSGPQGCIGPRGSVGPTDPEGVRGDSIIAVTDILVPGTQLLTGTFDQWTASSLRANYHVFRSQQFNATPSSSHAKSSSSSPFNGSCFQYIERCKSGRSDACDVRDKIESMGKLEEPWEKKLFEKYNCPICLDYVTIPVILNGKSFCADCIGKVDKDPLTQQTIEMSSIQPNRELIEHVEDTIQLWTLKREKSIKPNAIADAIAEDKTDLLHNLKQVLQMFDNTPEDINKKDSRFSST